MSSFSQFVGVKPIRTVPLTSGTGTFTPLMANSWCRVTIVGAGQGGGQPTSGGTVGAGGGSPGAVGVFWVRIPGSLPYVVGAGGLGATSANSQGAPGGTTALGSMTAPGGSGAGSGNVQMNGSTTGISTSSSSTNAYLGLGFNSIGNGAGGAAGQPGGTAPGGGSGGAQSGGTHGGGGGGGGNPYGTAGNGGAANSAGNGQAGTNASGYGAGGGGGGAGSLSGGAGGNGAGGLILIEEFGA